MAKFNCLECAECFERAMAIEVAMRLYYQRLATLFAQEPEAAETFSAMALDEDQHIQKVEYTKSRGIHPPIVHSDLSGHAQKLAEFLDLVNERTKHIFQNLDEALESSVELERSEIQDIHMALVSPTMTLPEEGDQYVASILFNHINRLTVLSKRIDKARRLNVFPKS